jgi:dTDP-4-amino-4,6-dideoxygalactose transaminase
LRLPIFIATPGEKQRLQSLSRARGLGLAAAYPTPVSEIPQVRIASLLNGQRFPSARKVADSLLTIPTHRFLSENDKNAITELCKGLAADAQDRKAS